MNAVVMRGHLLTGHARLSTNSDLDFMNTITVTNPGCLGTTRIPNLSRHSESIPCHKDQRRPAKYAAM
ncbi:hypothetical protein LAZ67_X001735 [Cordylochernes scorpioides]|uniref:Uncharacterized protein n=1 Tax=Cordylochernes scorpioides TaxID=51811 RepID=A0ABY6LSQ2_9ARAC|nr:hypothetical protein LAZ67_X001735 [Cordylochernes scorpioides]